eukprot:TRINITY_DN1113_c0_g5_i2.p1 TRINITY_DN1113_c0_g5~~TRINITY_DN1113_c0_g5_i2.p1  ORF type:complete len:196 (-),score=54.45 TRINITY_DN1113_c0_g5_i2:198-785(-)
MKALCVGETSSSIIQERFQFTKDKILLRPSAEQLVTALKEEWKGLLPYNVEQQKLNVLYLCGNQRRNELPSFLSVNKIPFYELCVYETSSASFSSFSSFSSSTQSRLLSSQSPDLIGQRSDVWVCFFSPSGVNSISQSEEFKSIFTAESQVRKAAIGKTTAEELMKVFGSVEVVAESPNAPSLVKAIQGFYLNDN